MRPGSNRLRPLVITLTALAAAGCGSTTNHAAPATPGRCVPVGAGLHREIQSAVHTSDFPNVRVGVPMAVRSHDYTRVWFVSAKLHDRTLDSSGANVATWAVSSLNGLDGPLFSADAMAKTFSGMGEIPGGGGVGDDGYSESQDCVG